MSSLLGSLNVSFTQDSSCILPSKDTFYYYLHNIMCTSHSYTLFDSKFNRTASSHPASEAPSGEGTTNVPRSDCSFAKVLGCFDISSSTFSLDFCNIRGYTSNFQSLEHHLFSTKPHKFLLTETQLFVTTDSSPPFLCSFLPSLSSFSIQRLLLRICE